MLSKRQRLRQVRASGGRQRKRPARLFRGPARGRGTLAAAGDIGEGADEPSLLLRIRAFSGGIPAGGQSHFGDVRHAAEKCAAGYCLGQRARCKTRPCFPREAGSLRRPSAYRRRRFASCLLRSAGCGPPALQRLPRQRREAGPLESVLFIAEQ